MDLDEKLGQMLMLGFRGQRLDDDHPFSADLRAGRIGSVVLFDYDCESQQFGRNLADEDQLRRLTADLQARSPVPLLISIDQEGGQVGRLHARHGFPTLPSARALGQSVDPEATRQAVEPMAQRLAAVGINLNLAPTVDLDVNPQNPVIGAMERSFAADPDRVTAHAAAFIKAHRAHNVACTLKHFPGHGSSTEDSHLDLVDVTQTWTEAELAPYRHLVDAGLADAVMTAHVYNRRLDPEYPATLSRPTLDGCLRQELGFDGVVISDDLQMGAIAHHYGLKTALHRAVDAGVDILVLANNTLFEENVAAHAIALLKELVADGTLPISRIDQSLARIQRLKAAYII